ASPIVSASPTSASLVSGSELPAASPSVVTLHGAPSDSAASPAPATATATTTATAPATATATVAPSLADLAAAASGPRENILVKFKSGSDADQVIKGSGGQSTRSLSQIHTRVISVPSSLKDRLLDAYKHHPSVERAAPTIKPGKAGTPDDPGYSQQRA